MISENARNYENVVIRNEQEVGINNFGLDYLVSLEQEVERLQEELDKTRLSELNKEYIINELENVLKINIMKQ